MNASGRQARELFVAALKLAPEEWDDYLRARCGDDTALRDRARELLHAHAEAGSFLDRPVAALDPKLALGEEPSAIAEGPGTVIGPYKLLEQIGEGGMGLVFVAEQAGPVRRRVALKVIKPGMDSRQVIARFEAERQALALMDHVNIARVVDGGTTENGRPYFVMELVHGMPITRFCDDNHLTPRERLELFVPVCQAVQHAHHKGIIHRDLKPPNILVARYDDRPVPKVIDFGVAKATGTPLTDETPHTGFGAVVGTAEYMSPEQASFNQIDVDTRSDIYSLGVLLYELLTGTTPLDRKRLTDSTLLEVLRTIREDDPPKPSTRLSTADGLPTLAVRRGTEPKRLTALVRGELDWIVMKCLEKDRARRYESAGGLARDVERYLRDEPVEASPPGAGYRLRKFVKRHKGRVVAAGLVLVALLAGMAGTSWGLIRAEQARRVAVAAQHAEAQRAEGERRAREEAQKRLAQIVKGTEILASVFRDLDPKAEETEGVTLRVLLGRGLGEAARQLEGDAVGDPLVVARLQHVLGVSLSELGHPEQAEVVFDKAWRTQERLLGADHPDTAATKHHLAGLYGLQGKHAPAEGLFKEVLAVRTAKLGADHPDTLATQNRLAVLYQAQGKHAPAEGLFKEVLAVRTAKLGADHPDTAATKHHLAGLYGLQGKHAPAEGLFKEVLAVRTAKLGADHPDTLTSQDHLALLYRIQGKYAPAEALCQEVLAVRTAKLGADHPATLATQHHLALLYRSMKKLDLSIPLLEEALRRRKARFDPDHPETLGIQADLGVTFCDAGRFADGIALLEEAHRKARGHSVLAWVGDDLLTAYARAGQTAAATALAAEQVRAARAQFPADSPQLAVALAAAGKALLDAKAYADAEPLLLQGYEGMTQREATIPPPSRVRLTETLERLVQLYDAWDKPDEAAKWRKELEAQTKPAEQTVKPGDK